MKRKVTSLLKSNEGLTLVELILAMAIFAIITTMAMSIFMPMMRAMMRASETAEYNTMFDNLSTPIISDLANSIDIPIPVGDPLDLDELILSVNSFSDTVYSTDANGVIVRAINEGVEIPVMAGRFYRWTSALIGFRPDLAAVANGERAYILTITLRSRNGGVSDVSREYTVKPLVLNQY